MTADLSTETTADPVSLVEYLIKREAVPLPPRALQGKILPLIEPTGSDFLDLLRLADDGCPNCQDVGEE